MGPTTHCSPDGLPHTTTGSHLHSVTHCSVHTTVFGQVGVYTSHMVMWSRGHIVGGVKNRIVIHGTCKSHCHTTTDNT